MASVAAAEFKFYLSSDIDHPVKVKVDRLLGHLEASLSLNANPTAGNDPTQSQQPMALYVEAQLCAYGETLGLPCRTRWAAADASDCTWDAWLSFPIKYKDLPHNAQLAVTIWGRAVANPLTPLASATLRLFSKRGRLKTGPQTAHLWLGSAAHPDWLGATPAKPPVEERGEIGRVEQVLKRYARHELQRIEWLDHLAFAEVDRLRRQDASSPESQRQPKLFLELPAFEHAVLYEQATSVGASGTAVLAPPSQRLAQLSAHDGGGLIVLNDPEVGRENPAELKAQKLARSVVRGVLDRDARPDTQERARITAVLQLPPNRLLSADEKALMWRFRWSLTSEKRALTKFLACVDWGDAQEGKQAAELMTTWAFIDIADALELLSPSFPNLQVRGHAVEVLGRAGDEELCQYLLQLVQALRYEAGADSKLSRFLVARAANNPVMGIRLHWYLYTEFQDPIFGTRAAAVHGAFQSATTDEIREAISRQVAMVAQLRHIVAELAATRRPAAQKAAHLRAMVSEHGLCGDLIDLRVPCPLDPTIELCGIVPAACSVFKSALLPLKLAFRTEGAASERILEVEGSGHSLITAGGPSSPSTGAAAVGRDSSCSTAAAASATTPERYSIIFKVGDDLRQDQLVLQLFELMDRLLKRENLDLRLTPYRVLPTSSDGGMIEFVESVSLARVLADHRTILAFLHQGIPDAAGRAAALDTFVRSCAGYCVMTYILGVGDRHLDNLMLCADGRLFHIDFGFIMGRDPKPFPPPMKLCKEMVDAMGGADSAHYQRFRTLCCEAYNILRKSAGLILSLVHLMAGASITDIRPDPEKALLKLQEKLRLDTDDEGAVEWMQQLLNESATALMPQIMETTHKWAQYWR